MYRYFKILRKVFKIISFRTKNWNKITTILWMNDFFKKVEVRTKWMTSFSTKCIGCIWKWIGVTTKFLQLLQWKDRKLFHPQCTDKCNDIKNVSIFLTSNNFYTSQMYFHKIFLKHKRIWRKCLENENNSQKMHKIWIYIVCCCFAIERFIIGIWCK